MVYLFTVLFIVFDMLTGIIKAFKTKKFRSKYMREGLFHKCGSLLCIVFGVCVEYSQLYLDLGVSIPVSSGICAYIILMEIGSIIENICEINPEILPDKLKQYFKKLGR